MTDELEREYEKLEEIETRYHQVVDTYREHIHNDEVSKWWADEEACKQIAAEWQVQMDEIRRIADGKETAEEKEAAEEQRIDELKEQVEDEFVPEEDQPKYELDDMQGLVNSPSKERNGNYRRRQRDASLRRRTKLLRQAQQRPELHPVDALEEHSRDTICNDRNSRYRHKTMVPEKRSKTRCRDH